MGNDGLKYFIWEYWRSQYETFHVVLLNISHDIILLHGVSVLVSVTVGCQKTKVNLLDHLFLGSFFTPPHLPLFNWCFIAKIQWISSRPYFRNPTALIWEKQLFGDLLIFETLISQWMSIHTIKMFQVPNENNTTLIFPKFDMMKLLQTSHSVANVNGIIGIMILNL